MPKFKNIFSSEKNIEKPNNFKKKDSIIDKKKRSLGGIITEKDLADYETVVDDAPLISTLLPGDLEMCGPPPPSSFVVTQSLIVTMGGNSIFYFRTIQIFIILP